MMKFITIVQSFGDQMIEHFWLPVVIWTLVAVPIVSFLRKNESLQPIHHYHSRTALLIVLPLGIVGAYLADVINSITQTASEGMFIVIQNPIPAFGAAAELSVLNGLRNPLFWIGTLSIMAGLVASGLLLKLLFDFLQLKNIEKNLAFSPLIRNKDLITNLPSTNKKYQNTLIAYSDDTNIPFTYGWLTTKIVVPTDLKEKSSSLAMAVQHELIHIKNHDFLLNSLLVTLKALFWFHPLVHHLYASREEYNEIICNSEVLSTRYFSQKQYASLLFELAKQEHQQNLALSMAVNPSSLKKTNSNYV